MSFRVVFWQQRQSLPRVRMKIFAQPQKLVTSSHTGQTQIFSSFAEPLTENLLPLGVIVPPAQMLLEIALGITETVLSFRGQHSVQSRIQFHRLIRGDST